MRYFKELGTARAHFAEALRGYLLSRTEEPREEAVGMNKVLISDSVADSKCRV